MRYFNSILLVFFLLGLISCREKKQTSENEFLIQIDSIIAPDTVVKQQPFEIKLFGTVGNNSLYQFNRMHINYDSLGNPTLMVIGHKNDSSAAVNLQKVILDGYPCQLNANCVDSLQLNIINPGYQQTIKRNIVVKQ